MSTARSEWVEAMCSHERYLGGADDQGAMAEKNSCEMEVAYGLTVIVWDYDFGLQFTTTDLLVKSFPALLYFSLPQ